jgi:hypothetical protein
MYGIWAWSWCNDTDRKTEQPGEKLVPVAFCPPLWLSTWPVYVAFHRHTRITEMLLFINARTLASWKCKSSETNIYERLWGRTVLLFYVYEARKMTCWVLKCFDITTDLLHCVDGELRVLMLYCLMKRCFALWLSVCVLTLTRTNHCAIKRF